VLEYLIKVEKVVSREPFAPRRPMSGSGAISVQNRGETCCYETE
jgi:hypothetical protein